MVLPKKDTAYVEAFFTQKNKDLYCIMPSYKDKLVLKNLSIKPSAKASVLGANKAIPLKKEGINTVVDLSALRPGDISSSGIFVVKLEGILN